MSYAIATDIESEFKNLNFSDLNAALTSAEVTELIEQEEAVINATISNRYEIPVTGVEALKVMKDISIAYVTYRVATILNLKKDVSTLLSIKNKFIPQELNESSKFVLAKKRLADIQSGKIVLNDAVARSTEQGIKSYNSINSIGPLWERDTRQW